MIDMTAASYVIAAIVAYYLVLFAVSLGRRELAPRASGSRRAGPLFVVLIPARNEALVLRATLEHHLRLRYEQFLLLVVNDGSTDGTAEIARAVASTAPHGRVVVVDRDPAEAGQGKSAVLNEGFRVVEKMLASGDARLRGRTAGDIVMGILDADGVLDLDSLEVVAPYFDDPGVGSVQLGVQIANASTSLLARMQDMEFVAFTFLVQVARDSLGSSGLGGNGQFTRLRALESLGPQPWTPGSLTEDLDLGLRLVGAGWRTRFCRSAFVAQQGLVHWRPLLRQRTRWIQGHYQCWRHIPAVVRSTSARWRTRIDLVAYLVLVLTVVLVFADFLIGAAAAFGLVRVSNTFLGFLSFEQQQLAQFAIAVLPVSAFLYTYQRYGRAPLAWWEVPAFALAFTVYSYVWIVVTLRAWFRIATGRWQWVKTPRVGIDDVPIRLPAAAQP